MSKTFTPSPYQQEIFKFVKNDKAGNAIIVAVAGSGKTTTIVKAANEIPFEKDTIFLAFNKSIQIELESRLPKHCQCMTINSFGYRAVRKRNGGQITIDSNKTWEVIEMVDKDYPEKSSLKKLVGFVKSLAIHPVDLNMSDVIEYHALDFNGASFDWTFKALKSVLEKSIELSVNVIDFDDQIYLPAIDPSYKMPKFDVILVDEAQDLNPAQLLMIERAMKSSGSRVIAVGDEMQAIYGFRGADCDSMKNIERKFNAKRLPLSVSYRCPKSVVEEARRFSTEILPCDTAKDGEVRDLGKNFSVEDFKPEDMVICRMNAPLVAFAHSLIQAKKNVRFLGRDFSQSLISLVKKMRANSIEDLKSKVTEWCQKEITKLLKKSKDADVSSIVDRKETICVFIKEFAPPTIDALIKSIDSLFDDKREKAVILCSAHKSKGLEAERVFILNKNLMMMHAKREWQKVQEKNLFYVAVTRSKDKLFYIED